MPLLMPILKKNGLLERIHVTVGIVGSRKMDQDDDYSTRGWELFSPNMSIYGFDADADACDVANADLEKRQIEWTEKHFPIALGKAAEERTLYVTKAPMCSSLYPPNEPYLARIAGLTEIVGLDFSFEIDTITLDQFCQEEDINEIDYLQIDVQGADLDVLRGATNILNRSVLGIQIEVEFSHLYVGQPLFADVDSFARKNNFTLFDVRQSYRHRARSPICSEARGGQLLWGEAYYLRDLISDDISEQYKSPDNLLKLACIADILGFPDYSLEVLEYLTLQYGTNTNYNCADSIIECLTNFPDLVDRGLSSLPIVQSIRQFTTKDFGF
ncbi:MULTISPECIES: FkbM family methyltransferase [Pseudanabaena]|uniref:FkbM family methyltransferase n=1 Tax=Pseudanabaena TaxID=1152 RepID=UPI0024786B26|nr:MULTISPECIES: FkbM family methyltransferase [Pseudanabaena]MEA5488627.1 FkbM family methyltransferase [Pseudanabaena sp. CCNP1317]WGS70983.1 FkbM family methyltransferase [Pseudanabaena galeata CCNP1313]